MRCVSEGYRIQLGKSKVDNRLKGTRSFHCVYSLGTNALAIMETPTHTSTA
jgi:hypothetical protein